MNDDDMTISDLIRILKLIRPHVDDETLYEEDGHLVIALSKDAFVDQNTLNELGEYGLCIECDDFDIPFIAIYLGGEEDAE